MLDVHCFHQFFFNLINIPITSALNALSGKSVISISGVFSCALSERNSAFALYWTFSASVNLGETVTYWDLEGGFLCGSVLLQTACALGGRADTCQFPGESQRDRAAGCKHAFLSFLGEAESWEIFICLFCAKPRRIYGISVPKLPSPFSPRQLDCAKPISTPRLTRLIQASSLGRWKSWNTGPWINFFPPQGIAESSRFFHPIHSMLSREEILVLYHLYQLHQLYHLRLPFYLPYVARLWDLSEFQVYPGRRSQSSG